MLVRRGGFPVTALGVWRPDGPVPTAVSVLGETFVAAWTTSGGAAVLGVALVEPDVTLTRTRAITTTTTSPPATHGSHARLVFDCGCRGGSRLTCLVRVDWGRLGPPLPPFEDVRPDWATLRVLTALCGACCVSDATS